MSLQEKYRSLIEAGSRWRRPPARLSEPTFVAGNAEAANLLPRRMLALDIEPDNVRRIESILLGDLQKSCSQCECQRQCAADLDCNSADGEWQDYCPNVATLKMLSALPWLMRSHL